MLEPLVWPREAERKLSAGDRVLIFFRPVLTLRPLICLDLLASAITGHLLLVLLGA